MLKKTEKYKSFYTMSQQMSGKEIRCLDCKCCCVKEKKCYPKSEDCETEYNLNDEDIYIMRKYDCDFYVSK